MRIEMTVGAGIPAPTNQNMKEESKLLIDSMLDKACESGMLIKRDDGTMVFIVTGDTPHTPWEVSGDWDKNDCNYWFGVMSLPGFGIGKSFIPTTCLNCWKVVAKPKTLRDLNKVLTIQKKQGVLCKCGIEIRATVFGLYGAYWYNTSLEEGLNCYQTVRKLIDDNLERDTVVLLKRGCTEYELSHGDSSKWETPDWLGEVEEYIKSKVRMHRVFDSQSEYSLGKIHESWVRFAYQNGDETYLDFTDGQPLYPAYQTYHHLIDEKGEEDGKSLSYSIPHGN